MKVLFVSNVPSPYQIDFLSALQNQVELKAHFLWPHGRNLSCTSGRLGRRMRIANFRYRVSQFREFRKFFLEFKPDVVIFTGYAQPLSGYCLYLCARYRVKVVHWLERPLPHGRLLNSLKLLYAAIRLATTTSLLAIGKSSADFYGKVFGGNVLNFPYSLDLNPFLMIDRVTKPRGKEPLRLLYSGQLIKRKNVINLLAAVQGVDPDRLTLTLIGSGELEKQLTSLAAGDRRISIKGFIDQGKLADIFADHDLFILPSRHDGWGVVVVEAMAAGLPIIATKNVGAAADLIKHRENGYLCETNVASIRAAISFYLDNQQLLDEQGRINRELVAGSSLNCSYGAGMLAGHLREILGKS